MSLVMSDFVSDSVSTYVSDLAFEIEVRNGNGDEVGYGTDMPTDTTRDDS